MALTRPKSYSWKPAKKLHLELEFTGQDKNGNCNNGAEIPTINQQDFPNTEATWFWSGSADIDYSDSALYVSFYSGYSAISYPSNHYAVRLVRGGQ